MLTLRVEKIKRSRSSFIFFILKVLINKETMKNIKVSSSGKRNGSKRRNNKDFSFGAIY